MLYLIKEYRRRSAFAWAHIATDQGTPLCKAQLKSDAWSLTDREPRDLCWRCMQKQIKMSMLSKPTKSKKRSQTLERNAELQDQQMELL